MEHYGESKQKKVSPFQRKPKKTNVPTKEPRRLFEETEEKGIEKGAFRRFLKLKADEKVTITELRRIIRVEPGSTFRFRDRTLTQTERSILQARLALNMMQKK